MAAISVREISKEVAARKTVDGGLASTHVYVVVCSKVSDGPEAACDAYTLPQPGDAHETAVNLYVSRIYARPTEDRKIFHVYVEYETPTHRTLQPNPLDDPVHISWGTWVRSEPTYHDNATPAGALLNSAEDPYDPPLMGDVYESTVTIIRNELVYNPVTAQGYKGAVNSDSTTIAGYPVTAREAMVVRWDATTQERNGYDYWQVTYEVVIRETRVVADDTITGWDRSAVDLGLNTLKAGTVARIQIEDGAQKKVDVTTPQLLDKSGDVLDKGGTPRYNTWRVADEKVFAALGLNI